MLRFLSSSQFILEAIAHAPRDEVVLAVPGGRPGSFVVTGPFALVKATTRISQLENFRFAFEL